MILEYLNSHVDVIINDELGNALLGSIPVEVVVNGTSILNTTIVDGVLKDTIPTENLPAGEYSVEFNIQPDEFGIYNEKILTSKLNIIKRDAILTVEADTTKVLNTLAINVTLNDENMTINSGNVVFKINNKVVRDENGNPIKVHVKDNKAQLNYTLPQEIGQGHYNITAVYESNTYNKVENSPPCDIEGLYIDVKDLNMSDEMVSQIDRHHYGLDFGFAVDPLAFNAMHYDKKHETLYIFDEIHKYRFDTNLAAIAVKKKAERRLVIADSAEPRTIRSFEKFGCNIKGAKKGPDSVEHGIKFLQDLRAIYIDPNRCPETYKEFVGYEYQQDKNGNFLSAYPDKNNHHIDAVRYAMESEMLDDVYSFK